MSIYGFGSAIRRTICGVDVRLCFRGSGWLQSPMAATKAAETQGNGSAGTISKYFEYEAKTSSFLDWVQVEYHTYNPSDCVRVVCLESSQFGAILSLRRAYLKGYYHRLRGFTPIANDLQSWYSYSEYRMPSLQMRSACQRDCCMLGQVIPRKCDKQVVSSAAESLRDRLRHPLCHRDCWSRPQRLCLFVMPPKVGETFHHVGKTV